MPAENAWRCTACRRVSNAAAQPHSHVRNGQPCGPFAPAVIGSDGTVLVEAPPIERPTTYRQSLLRSFEVCPRRALHDLLLPGDLSVGNVGASADLGSCLHAVVAEILRTLSRQKETQISTQEGIEIMREVYARGPWVLPAEDRDDLRAFTLSFCTYYSWTRPPIAIEGRPAWAAGDAPAEPLSMDIMCPDGRTRRLTGTPDVVLADPGPSPGLIVIDWKSGRGKPRSPRQMPDDGQPIVGREYLSVEGTYQLDVYGLLAMNAWPLAQHVTLREAWLRFGERREATLDRSELEHVEHEIAIQMMKLDQAIDEGPDSGSKLTNPRPGRHCARACPVALSCPIPDEQRGDGAIRSPDCADENARRLVKVSAVRTDLLSKLKAWHESTGHCPEVGDGTVIRWSNEKAPRKFGAHPPLLPSPAADSDPMAPWLASLEAQQETGAAG